MKRYLITFTDPQMQYLAEEALRLDISIAELTRRILDSYLAALDTQARPPVSYAFDPDNPFMEE
jgi:hypothetical protein